MRPSWLAMALLLSCSRETPTSGLAIVAASGTAGSPTSMDPPAPRGPLAAREPAACWIAAGYRGAVLGLPVFARLSRDGGRLHGRYFYERTLDFGRVTIDLRTGRPVTTKDVFVPGRDPVARVAACAARATPFDVSMDADEWTSHLDLAQFDLAEDGVHFFGSNFPHVMAVLAGQGPVIGYDVLLRDGMLRTDSPVKRAWRGVAAAARGKPWCADVKGDAGWR